MKLFEILNKHSDSVIDQIAGDKMDESASLRLPRNIVQQEVISALSSLSYIGSKLNTSKPPTYAILKVLLDSEGYCHPVEGFRDHVFQLVHELVAMADSGKGLSGNKNYELYLKMLVSAWKNDSKIDESEGRILQVLREQLGIWTREHLLLEYHTEVRSILGSDKGYVEARNRLLSSGLVLSIDNNFLIGEEVVWQIRRAWDMDIDDIDYRRILDALTNDQLYRYCQSLGLVVSGSKDDKLVRIIKGLVPPKELLDLMTIDELSSFCSKNEIKVSGNKFERIGNIVDYFDQKRDLEKVTEENETVQPEAQEEREMSCEDFKHVLEHLSNNQLQDILSGCYLKTSGSKEEKIKRLLVSNWSDRNILGRLRGSDLYQLCSKLDVKVSGLKTEKIDRIIEEVKVASQEVLARAEIEEEETYSDKADEKISLPKVEDLVSENVAKMPLGIDDLEKEYPFLDKDELIILALLKDAKSLTERDVERASKRHKLGWFLTKAHMTDMIAKLNKSGRNPLGIKSLHSINIYEWLGSQGFNSDGLSRKIARNIVDAIRQGVVPGKNLEYLAVGQTTIRKHFSELIEETARGKCFFKFIRGPYGAGKSFVCSWLKEQTLEKDLIVSNIVIGPNQPLSDLPVFFAGLVQGIRTPEKRDGNALADILESWLLGIHRKTAKIEGVEIGNSCKVDELGELVEQRVEEELETIASLDPSFAPAVRAFYRARLAGDLSTAVNAISWLSGSHSLSSNALKSIGVKGVLEPNTVFSRLRALLKVIAGARYRGFVLLVDEVELIRRYPHQKSREQAYETLRLLIDEVGKNELPSCLIIFTGTDSFFEDERAGLPSYEALANRVLSPMDNISVKSFKQPVVELEGLNKDKLKNVVSRVRDIHGVAYKWDAKARMPDAEIDEQLGQCTTARSETITRVPRPVLRELVQILDILEENPKLSRIDIRPQITDEQVAQRVSDILSN